MISVFQRIKDMNISFGNPEGDPKNIQWDRVRAQCKNILDEFIELQSALGADEATLQNLTVMSLSMANTTYKPEVNLKEVRDSLCDIVVFAGGGHHFMGIDHDRDMDSVLSSLSSRFVKDDQDLFNTTKYHAERGVVSIAFEGDYPTVVARSTADQPDAPKGKFLKSASYTQPSFYSVE